MDFCCKMGCTKIGETPVTFFGWRCSGITCSPYIISMSIFGSTFEEGFFKFLHQMGSHFGVFFCWHFWRCKLMGAKVCFRIWIHVTKVAPSTFDVEDAVSLFHPCYEVQCFKSVKIHVLFSKNTCSFFALRKSHLSYVRDMSVTWDSPPRGFLGGIFFCPFFFIYTPEN